MADGAVTSFERVERVPVGAGLDGPEYSVVRTGRMRRPESLAEWSAMQVALLGSVARSLPAGKVVVALLEAGEDADVKAAGRDLTDWQRRGVGLELDRLARSARQEYPAAGPLMTRLHSAWVRKWGTGERVLPPHVRDAPAGRAVPTSSLVDNPPDAAHWAAAWACMRTVPRGA